MTTRQRKSAEQIRTESAERIARAEARERRAMFLDMCDAIRRQVASGDISTAVVNARGLANLLDREAAKAPPVEPAP